MPWRPGPLEETVDGCGEDRAIAVTADMRRREDVAALLERSAAAFGGIDVVVSDSGTSLPGQISEISDEDWHAASATDIDGSFCPATEAEPHLQRSRGALIAASSGSGPAGDDCERTEHEHDPTGHVACSRRALRVGREGLEPPTFWV